MSASGIPVVSAPARAVRVDKSGIRDEAEFFGESGARVFGCIHLPAGAPAGGVVVCPGLHAELLKNYHPEVIFGRSAAGLGVAVQRFHPRGSGHSDWDSSQATFETMVEDAIAAARRLLHETGVERIGFLGTSFGTLVAAAAASGFPGAPLALWDPVLDTDRYFRDVFRIPLVQGVAQGVPPPQEDPLVVMDRRGLVDVIGFPIDRALYKSSAGRTLAGELGASPRPVLFAQMKRRKDLTPGSTRLVDDLRAHGFDVDVELVPQEPAWWLFSEPVYADALIQATSRWFARALGGVS